jgi:hypothetical protein
LYGAETWRLRKIYGKYLETFEVWYWRRMESSWTDCVRYEVLGVIKGGRIILHTIKLRNANWIGHILRENCRLKDITEGKIEGMRRQERRRKRIQDDLNERTR